MRKPVSRLIKHENGLASRVGLGATSKSKPKPEKVVCAGASPFCKPKTSLSLFDYSSKQIRERSTFLISLQSPTHRITFTMLCSTAVDAWVCGFLPSNPSRSVRTRSRERVGSHAAPHTRTRRANRVRNPTGNNSSGCEPSPSNNQSQCT
jgi:hypothetical protein